MMYYGDIKLQSYKTSLPQVSMTSDRALEKFYCTHILAEGTKTRLVLRWEIQESIIILFSYQVCDKESVSSESMDCQTHDKDEQWRWCDRW